jgi:hypothetical protein
MFDQKPGDEITVGQSYFFFSEWELIISWLFMHQQIGDHVSILLATEPQREKSFCSCTLCNQSECSNRTWKAALGNIRSGTGTPSLILLSVVLTIVDCRSLPFHNAHKDCCINTFTYIHTSIHLYSQPWVRCIRYHWKLPTNMFCTLEVYNWCTNAALLLCTPFINDYFAINSNLPPCTNGCRL